MTNYYNLRKHNNDIDAQVHMDAYLTGLGGAYGSMVYTLLIIKGYQGYTIVLLEILNILVVLKIWVLHWRDERVEVFCDNLAVVEVLTASQTRDHNIHCRETECTSRFALEVGRYIEPMENCNICAQIMYGQIHTYISHH